MFIPTSLANYANELQKALHDTNPESVEKTIKLLRDAFDYGINIYTCGNGGSAAISNHLVCDCVKGVACDTHFYPRIQSLNCNDSILTAIGNDIGFDEVFARQLHWSANANEILIVISSSGNSPNIINALKTASGIKMKSIAIVGFNGGEAKNLADICIHIPSDNYGIVEDASQAIMHYIAQQLRIRHTRKATEELKL